MTPRWILLLSHSWVLDTAVPARDREAAETLVSSILEIVGESQECWRATDGNTSVAVYKTQARILECDVDFCIGDKVTLADGRYTGTVCGIGYHFERSEPIYSLDVDGKRKSRRYFSADLVMAEKADAQ